MVKNKINCWEGRQYKLEDSDNYDAYMKELGMGLVQRKLGNSQQPIVLLHKVESTHNLITIIDKKPRVLTFKLSKEFDEETFDMRQVKIKMLMFDNTLIEEQEGLIDTKITREFHLHKMIEKSVVNKVAATRVFLALNDDEKEDVSELIEKLEKEQKSKKNDCKKVDEGK